MSTCARLDAVALAEPLAERLVAADRPVVEHRRPVALDGRARAVGELLDRQALGRGTPRAKEIVAMT